MIRVVVGNDSATAVETWNIFVLGGLISRISPVQISRIERLFLPMNLNGAVREEPSFLLTERGGVGGASTGSRSVVLTQWGPESGV